MARLIIKLGGKYLEWSTVVDAPITRGMTLDELHEYVRVEQGREGLEALPARLERVEATGSSSISGYTLDDCIAGNRAGPREAELSKDELIAKYCADD